MNKQYRIPSVMPLKSNKRKRRNSREIKALEEHVKIYHENNQLINNSPKQIRDRISIDFGVVPPSTFHSIQTKLNLMTETRDGKRVIVERTDSPPLTDNEKPTDDHPIPVSTPTTACLVMTQQERNHMRHAQFLYRQRLKRIEVPTIMQKQTSVVIDVP
jgi:hypothetical protein